MRLADISLDDVREGSNWKVLNPEELEGQGRPGFLYVEKAGDWGLDDYAVYPGLSVTDSGKVTALLMVRMVGEGEYGGVYYDFKNGQWEKVGVDPEPDAEFSNECVANPPQGDRSFDSPNDELRTMNRREFQDWIGRL